MECEGDNEKKKTNGSGEEREREGGGFRALRTESKNGKNERGRANLNIAPVLSQCKVIQTHLFVILFRF